MPPGDIPTSWQKRIIEKITREEANSYAVFEIKPNRKRDTEVYQFSGTDEGCIHQVSQFLAIREFINRKLGDWDFKDMIKAFEEGFIFADAPVTNQNTTKPWGKPYNNRPRFRELWTEEKADLKGYYAFDFYPDRENQRLYKLVGSPLQILDQALNLMQSKPSEDLDWKEFVKEFEAGFPSTIAQSISKSDKPWGLSIAEAPRFYDLWSEADAEVKGYYGVIFVPNRAYEDDKFILVGTRYEIAQQAIRIMQEREMLNNVQRVVGMPVSEHIRHSPRTYLGVIISLSTYKEPPFYQTRFRGRYLEQTITIPFPDKSKMTYERIRNACGGTAGLNWGRHRATAWIIPKNASASDFEKGKGAAQLWVSGSSENNAVSNLERFIDLTEGKILRTSTSQVRTITGQILTTYDVYAKQMYVANKRLLQDSNQNQGRRTLWGKLDSKDNDFKLYPPDEPPRWSQTLKDLLVWTNQTA